MSVQVISDLFYYNYRTQVLYWSFINLPVDIPRTFGVPAKQGDDSG